MSSANKTSFTTASGDGYVVADYFEFAGGTILDETSLLRREKIVKVAVSATDTAGGFFSWANPESSSIIVDGIFLNITTQSSGACTVDIGTTATSATTLSDNMIDGLSVATAGLYSSFDDPGTNGKSDQLLASGKWVTGSVASGASAGVVGFVYIRYFVI